MSGSTAMGYVAVSDLDLAMSFYVDTLGADVVELPSAEDPALCVVRAPGVDQSLTLVEVRSGRTAAGGSTAEASVRADIELSRAAGAEPDEAGLWRTPHGDVVTWFRDQAGGIASLNFRAA